MENTNEKTKNIKKVGIIIPVVLVLIIAIISIIIVIKNNENTYKLENVTDFLYFRIYENERYGVIDTKGNIIIEPKYENIDIPNPSKGVFIIYTKYNEDTNKYETEVINEKNERILTNYNNVMPVVLKETNSQVPYEKSILIYEKDNKYGIIDFKGKKITDALYDSIDSLLYKEGCLLVTKNGKLGVINIKGKEVVNAEYDSITADGYYSENTKYEEAGFIVAQKKNEGYRYGYINNNGKILLETEYNEIHRITEVTDEKDVYILAFRNGLAGVYKNKKQIIKHLYEEIEYNNEKQLFVVQRLSKQGVLNKEGKQILNTEYDYILISGDKINTKKDNNLIVYDINGNIQDSQKNNTILATKDENYFITINEDEMFGVTNKNGEVIIENNYSYIEYAFNNYFIVTKDNKTGVIDNEKNEKIPLEYSSIQNISNTKMLQAIKNSSNITTEIYNENLENILTMDNAEITIKENYIKVNDKKNEKYFSNTGKELSSKEVYPNNNLLSYKENEKWGYVDREGNIKVQAIYEKVTEFNEYGFAGIKKEGKWGVINSEGKVIVEPSYTIQWDEPDFIGSYLKLNFGYGFNYYTKELADNN